MRFVYFLCQLQKYYTKKIFYWILQYSFSILIDIPVDDDEHGDIPEGSGEGTPDSDNKKTTMFLPLLSKRGDAVVPEDAIPEDIDVVKDTSVVLALLCLHNTIQLRKSGTIKILPITFGYRVGVFIR